MRIRVASFNKNVEHSVRSGTGIHDRGQTLALGVPQKWVDGFGGHFRRPAGLGQVLLGDKC